MKKIIPILLAIFIAVPLFSNPAQNKYYLESVRLAKLAQETYNYGDYEASANLAQEAIRYADMSDKYVAEQMMPEAKRLLDWADANNVETKFPNNYNEGLSQYETAADAYAVENWKETITAAAKTIEVFAALESASGGRKQESTASARQETTRQESTKQEAAASSGNPGQYTVRTWRVERDCFWTIAGYPWVYNDPFKWKILYEANKSKIPDPDNPDLIEPGMVLEIPSLEGEARQGMYRP